MRILVLSSLFYPEPTANAVRMAELTSALLRYGHQVEVITGFPYYRSNLPHPDFKGKYFVEKFWNEVRIIQCYTHVSRTTSIFERLLTFHSFAISSIIGALRYSTGKFDGLVAISPPFFTGFSAMAISRALRIPFIFDIQDLYPETAVRLGVLNNPVLIKSLEFAERVFYQKAAGMVGISKGFGDHFASFRVPPKAIEVIPNWVDEEMFKPQPFRNSIPTPENPLVVGFFGNHGLAQGLNFLLEGMALLKDESRVRFVMIGDGVEKPNLERSAAELGLSNLTMEPSCKHEQIPDKLKIFDVGVVHLRKNPLYRITIPCKTYEYMALGKPILIGVDGEARKVVEKVGAGFFFEPENPKAFCQTIRSILKNPQVLSGCFEKGRNAVEEQFGKNILGKKYVRFIERIFQKEPL